MANNPRYFSNIAIATTLANPGGISTFDTNLVLTSTQGYPNQFPFTLRLDPNSSLEELVLVNSGLGTAVTPYVCTRAYDGTSAKSHGQFSNVTHGASAADLGDPQQHIVGTGPAGAANPHGLPDSAWTGTTIISKQVLGADSSTVSFNSIPQTFTHLLVAGDSRLSVAGSFMDVLCRVNADSSSVYTDTRMDITGASTMTQGAVTASNAWQRFGSSAGTTASANATGTFWSYIVNYASPFWNTSYWSVQQMSDTAGNATYRLAIRGGNYAAVGAVTGLVLFPSSGNFKQNSYFCLYGLS